MTTRFSSSFPTFFLILPKLNGVFVTSSMLPLLYRLQLWWTIVRLLVCVSHSGNETRMPAIATSPGVEVRKYWHVDFGHRIWRSTAVIVVKFEDINSKFKQVRDVHSTAEIVKFERKWRQLKIKSNHWQNYSHSYSECSKCLPLPTFPPNNYHNCFRIEGAIAKNEEDEFFFENCIYPETDVTTATLSRAFLSHDCATLSRDKVADAATVELHVATLSRNS